MDRSTATALWAVVAIGLLATQARADDEAAAKAAFDQGTELFEGERFPEAAEAFREAYRLKPTWKLLFNIAQSEAASKRYGLSLEAFERYLAEGGDEISAERRDEVLDEVKRLREMVGSLEIACPEGAAVSIDGIERGTCPLSGSLLVVAGVDHRVEAVQDGETLLSRTVKVSGGQSKSLDVEEEEPEEPVAGQPDPPEIQVSTGDDSLKTAGWVTTGIGAALLVAGGATGGMALSANSDLVDECSGDAQCTESARGDDVDRRDNLALATDIMIGVGAAAAIVGVVMVIVGKKRDGGEADVALGPAVSPDGAGATVEWRF